MATQLLNADTMLATVQELMGHGCVSSTQRYARVSNAKVRRDYFKAMALIMGKNRSQGEQPNDKGCGARIFASLASHRFMMIVHNPLLLGLSIVSAAFCHEHPSRVA
jgi:hypothetical protein